ncbi:hypothetical protein GIB67_000996 [Kingdonia uniflora]|uniref:Uncharacterized protein n=1 Tax=Kingdonia uniflora TaxID=39325 RepID=A0A7J7MFS8_9MAGN|nr:hypothetical protein GIB67_000996 [Kingdonia uniflora]
MKESVAPWTMEDAHNRELALLTRRPTALHPQRFSKNRWTSYAPTTWRGFCNCHLFTKDGQRDYENP